MNIWNKLFGRKAAPVEQKQFVRQASYQIVGGQIVSSPDNRRSYIENGYNVNDHIFSAVNLIKEKVVIAPWNVYTVKDESSLKKYKALMSKKDMTGDDFALANKLKTKALELYTGDERLNELLRYPNEYCTFPEFVGESSIFKMLTGGRTIWGNVLSGGANAGKVYSLEHLPYQHISIIVSTTFPQKILGYRYDSFIPNNPGIPTFTAEQVMHDKYPNPNYDSAGGQFYGHSPLKSALRLTDRSNSSNKAANALFENGGPSKVLFFDDTRFDPAQGEAQVAAIKKTLQGKEYSGADNKGKVAISGYPMGVADIGLSTEELQIIESEKWDLRRFCNVFGGIPSQLLNDPENKSYNNQKEGEKALTVRGALPLLNSFRDSFNHQLTQYWGYKDTNIYVDYDQTVYTELQDDNKDKWTWVRELPITWGAKLETMGMDFDPNAEGMDEIMIPSGFVPIDSMNVVDEELNRQGGDA